MTGTHAKWWCRAAWTGLALGLPLWSIILAEAAGLDVPIPGWLNEVPAEVCFIPSLLGAVVSLVVAVACVARAGRSRAFWVATAGLASPPMLCCLLIGTPYGFSGDWSYLEIVLPPLLLVGTLALIRDVLSE